MSYNEVDAVISLDETRCHANRQSSGDSTLTNHCQTNQQSLGNSTTVTNHSHVNWQSSEDSATVTNDCLAPLDQTRCKIEDQTVYDEEWSCNSELRINTGIKPIKFDIDIKAESDSENSVLQGHTRTQTSDATFVCRQSSGDSGSVTNHCYANRQSLEDFAIVTNDCHAPLDQTRCKIEDQTVYDEEWSCNSELRINTGIKPIKFDIDIKVESDSENSDLQGHTRTQTSDATFVCRQSSGDSGSVTNHCYANRQSSEDFAIVTNDCHAPLDQTRCKIEDQTVYDEEWSCNSELRINTGIKPIKFDIDIKAESDSENSVLQGHTRTQTSDETFVCRQSSGDSGTVTNHCYANRQSSEDFAIVTNDYHAPLDQTRCKIEDQTVYDEERSCNSELRMNTGNKPSQFDIDIKAESDSENSELQGHMRTQTSDETFNV
ncbi:unnamed protein product [Mytilus edulis]|uniref:Uncharacterized protein n=1 Tax=Mytilus edulis TaxID=6550 RepID=A0A8S3VSR8_MYTED|nr:unnamed protein product [Mytilus edulis]